MPPLDAQQQRSAAQFSRQSAHYGKRHILAGTSDVETLLAHLPRQAQGRPAPAALDVATGGGHTALALARAGFVVTLGDISEAMLDQARQLLVEAGFNPAAAACFPAESIPSGDDTFELVACRVAGHHFTDVAAFVRESARVLKPGGHLLVIDGSVPDDDPDTARWINRLEKLRDPSHGRLLSRAEWESLAAGAGLETVVSQLTPLGQPDLEWYFETAGTSPENRAAVRRMVANAPAHIRTAMALESPPAGPVRWRWQRLSLLARHPA